MANCCEEIPCGKLITIGDIERMAAAASSQSFGACNNYISSVTEVGYDECCSADGSGYCLTINDLLMSNHEFVDLKLDSGTLWATMNVGATSETDYGNYYQYGAKNEVYSATSATSVYDYYKGEENPLSREFDTASQVWGGVWHIPTSEQCEELFSATTSAWTTNYQNSGQSGVTFTRSGQTLFIPAAGIYYTVNNIEGDMTPSGNLSETSIMAFFWASTTPAQTTAKYFSSTSGGSSVGNAKRTCGMPVRAVVNPTYFQNWSPFNELDKDGIVVGEGWNDNTSCCKGVSNMPLSGVTFKYTEYSGFTVDNVTYYPYNNCPTSGESNFRYGLKEHTVSCTNGNYNDSTTSSFTYNKSNVNGLLGKIISAVSITDTEEKNPTNWTAFTEFISASTGSVEIYNQDIFTPKIEREVTSSSTDCVSASISLQSANARFWIKPKFRDCPQSEGHYDINISGESNSFTWFNVESWSDAPSTGFDDTRIGTFGDVSKSHTISCFYKNNGTSCNDDDYVEMYSYDKDGYSYFYYGDWPYDVTNVIGIKYDENENSNLLATLSANTSTTESRAIKITIKLEICDKDVSTSCCIIQASSTPMETPDMLCCLGLFKPYPTVECGGDSPFNQLNQ